MKENTVKQILISGRLPGILLALSALCSLLISNTSFSAPYIDFWIDNHDLSLIHGSITDWINNGLMSVFFFLVALEIRRELVRGELSDLRKAMLPVLSAFGGMAVPAMIYISINLHSGFLYGWAIPTATDIAFSLAVLSIAGNRIPFTLKIFLMALAIMDDLGAVAVIAIFYSAEIHLEMLLYSGMLIVFLLALNRLKVKSLAFYILPGVILWWCILNSGIHATIGGVLLAFCIPIGSVEKSENALKFPVNFLILPLFVLANTAISIPLLGLSLFMQPFAWGIILGLMIGKPAGIFAAAFLSVKAGITKLPHSVSWRKLLGAGCIAGTGFTMSIFIAGLAFTNHEILDGAKLSILLGSFISALTGLLVIFTGKVKRRENEY